MSRGDEIDDGEDEDGIDDGEVEVEVEVEGEGEGEGEGRCRRDLGLLQTTCVAMPPRRTRSLPGGERENDVQMKMILSEDEGKCYT